MNASRRWYPAWGTALALLLVLPGLLLTFPPPAAGSPGAGAAAAPALRDRYGVCQSHLMLYDAWDPLRPQLLEDNLDAVEAAGIGWVRCVFAWPDLEGVEEGKWTFEAADRVVDEAEERGISLLGVMLGSPRWANGDKEWNYPPTDLDAWGTYASTLSGRYAGRVSAWEVWNEEDIHAFWQPAPDSAAYVALLARASAAIRAADPDATIVMGGMAGLDSEYMEACLIAGAAEYVDAVAYHPYPETLGPPTGYAPKEELMRQLVVFVRWLISKYTSKTLEVWLTEFGWTTHTDPDLEPEGQSEAAQAAYTLRSLLNYAATSADMVFTYDLWEEMDAPAVPGYCYGLLHNDFTAKPAYHYYQRFEEVFGPATASAAAAFSFSCAAPDTLETGAWETGGSNLAVAAWKSDDAGDALDLTLTGYPLWYNDPVRVDLETGERTAVSGVTRDGRGNITVSGLAVGKTPVVLEFTPGSRWCLAEGSTDGDMETWVLVQNPGASPVQVDLVLETAEGPLALDALQDVTIPGASRRSFRLNDYCRTYDVSTLVTASGEVVAERATYGPGRAWATGSVGVSAASTAWCLAEGSTDGDMETWVLVQNPGASPVQVDLVLETAEGPLALDALQDVTIPGASRRSFRLNDYCRTYDVSTLVTASGEVVAERATYGPGRAWATGSVGVSAASTAWCLAEGSTDGDMETWVLVQNPGASPVQVDLVLETAEGPLALDALQDVTIPGASRRSFRLNDYCRTYDVSTLVTASGEVVAERATYGPGRAWATGSVGVSAASTAWCLAEGSTDGDMETWVLVQNPGASPVQVDLVLETAEGPLALDALQDVTIPGASRRSFRLNDYCRTYDVSTLVTASGEVVAERATYGPARAWATGSIGAPFNR